MPAPAPTPTAARKAHLDGLRAVAVYLVVAFHAGLGRFAGGFIGVDVFFVLSGYLVTQVLLRDLDGHGHVRFGRFYARRARRLLPASMAMLLIVTPLYVATATPAQAVELADALRAAFLYVSNWFFIARSTDYFAADTARSPVLHLWSLAVEEQFYVLWPLLLAGLTWATGRLARHRRWALRGAIALGAAASAGWALALRAQQPDRAYFGTDTRAYQLLAGALLAVSPALVRHATRHRLASQLATVGALATVVALGVTFGGLDPIERGLATTVATCILIVAIEAEVANPIRRALAVAPVVYLGQISYGTYLWHWPVVILLGEAADVSARSMAVIVTLVATGLASASYHLLERPIRSTPVLDRTTWPVAVSAVALSVLAATVVVPRLTDTGDRTTTAASTDVAVAAGGEFAAPPPQAELDVVFRERFGETVDCVDRRPQDCTVVRGSGRHVLLMGDSNAQMWIPAFTQLARDEDLTLSLAVAPGCLWQRRTYKMGKPVNDACRRVKDDAYGRVIPALDPDLIVLVNAREPQGPPDPRYRPDRLNQTLKADTPASLDALEAPGRQLLIIEPAPTPTDEASNPLDCLSKATTVAACRFVATQATSWHVALERELAARRPDLATADLSRLVCPYWPICDPILGDTVVFWNGEHLTVRYSRSLAPELARYLRDQGLLGG